ncbi:hypothetical protein [Saccharopolyspora sp. NPDC050642]|uniref:hypothetical protein n=1 Tax=Saccharopolyspora sp. NPDC050642 TaxID=3157099 RepID=UPI0033EF8AAE
MARSWDEDGEPVDLARWDELFSDLEYRYVGNTEISADGGTPHTVLAIWVGHAVDPGEPDMIYETAVAPIVGGTKPIRRCRTLIDCLRL